MRKLYRKKKAKNDDNDKYESQNKRNKYKKKVNNEALIHKYKQNNKNIDLYYYNFINFYYYLFFPVKKK